MDIIEYMWQEQVKKDGPLAIRMRPRSLEEFVGQEHILGEGKALRRAIEEDRLSSFIFYGPPGTGKTALAQIIASTTRSYFVRLNAVTSGVAEVRRVITGAKERRGTRAQKTILFIDEIHRFNKAQQDALLPAVEEGIVYLIGATTENPYFTINAPLLSRSLLFLFKPLGEKEISEVLQRALSDKERGLGKINVDISEGALSHIVNLANGDARVALNSLEMAILNTTPEDNGRIVIGLSTVEEILQRRALQYDKDGDNHYDVTSAFIKSIRGSDPDAALYWLARMLEGGEDPLFIARRLVISAAEDIGNADPQAIMVAVAASQAVQLVGLPEGRIPLAQATAYLATAPKSNASYIAIEEALREVQRVKAESVPLHLRDSSYPRADKLRHGDGYLYPHDYPGHYVPQDYLPQALLSRCFYRPTGNGYEEEIRKRLAKWRSRKGVKEELHGKE